MGSWLRLRAHPPAPEKEWGVSSHHRTGGGVERPRGAGPGRQRRSSTVRSRWRRGLVDGHPPAPLPVPPRSLHLPLPLDAVLVPFRQAQQLLQQSQLLHARPRPRGSCHLWRRTTWEKRGGDSRHPTTTANPIGRRDHRTVKGNVTAIGLTGPATQSDAWRNRRMRRARLGFATPRGAGEELRITKGACAAAGTHFPPPAHVAVCACARPGRSTRGLSPASGAWPQPVGGASSEGPPGRGRLTGGSGSTVPAPAR